MRDYIVGIDEAGRGPWAGPLVSAAVLVRSDWNPKGLKDSKKLTKKQRAHFYDLIKRQVPDIGVGWVSNLEIDKHGLSKAVTLSMRLALNQIQIRPKIIIIDGHVNYLKEVPGTQAIIKADQSVIAVAAASVVAKVTRDVYMRRIAKLYTYYNFESHVGYGTPAHHRALEIYGPCDIHRKSYKPVRIVSKNKEVIS